MNKFGAIGELFAEELGFVIEVALDDVHSVMEDYTAAGVSCKLIGKVRKGKAMNHSFIHYSVHSEVICSSS